MQVLYQFFTQVIKLSELKKGIIPIIWGKLLFLQLIL